MENFILDYALRRTMLKAHQQAWAWQDEWHNLTIEDIRRLEEKTQRELHEKYHQDSNGNKQSLKAATLPSVDEDHLSDDSDDFYDAAEDLSLRSRSIGSFHSADNNDEGTK